MRPLVVRDLGRMRYGDALTMQTDLFEQHRSGNGCDTLLLVEHDPVITMGRNGKSAHVLASPEILARSGIEFYETNRGGDATFHGPGQLVGYPVFDLRRWQRDVHALFVSVESALIEALQSLGVEATSLGRRGYEGVWVGGAKIAAIGLHLSRWISTHGFALNIDTDLDYFRYIVPCGLSEPVCSLRSLGFTYSRVQVIEALIPAFQRAFNFDTVSSSQENLALS